MSIMRVEYSVYNNDQFIKKLINFTESLLGSICYKIFQRLCTNTRIYQKLYPQI